MNLSEREMKSLGAVFEKIEKLIFGAEQVLVSSCTDAPSPSEFLKNPEITMQWVLENQETLTQVANIQTRVSIEDRRLWAFNEEMKRQHGSLEVEDLSRRVNFYLKSLRDITAMLKEKKFDLIQVITSVRSVQSATTTRFAASRGG